MIVVPRWFSAGIVSAIAVYTAAFAILWIATGGAPFTSLVALGCFGLAFSVGIVRTGRASTPTTLIVLGAGLLLPVLGSIGLDPGQDSYTSGAWFVSGIACLVVVLLCRRRAAAGWILLGGLILHTFAWGGLQALTGLGVVASGLLVAILAAGGWAVARTERHLSACSAAERSCR
jgi:hypothetical protein